MTPTPWPPLVALSKSGHPVRMRVPLATSGYDRVIVIDTQVVLETKPLEQLPWPELGVGPILLLVCRQVQSEIDAKKSDGRLGKRARAFNKLLDSFVETRTPVSLVTSPTRVDVALLANGRIDWDALDDLDRDDGDDRIIAQALNALVDDQSRLEVLSHDMRPRDAAVTHGLLASKLGEEWLRDPEPAPEDRERTRLQNELRILRSEQPQIEVAITTVQPAPWQRTFVEPASPEQIAAIQRELLRRAPVPPSRDPFGMGITLHDPSADYSLGDRLARWRKRLRESDLPKMHLGLEKLHAQYRVRVEAKNVGQIAAQGISLEIRSGNTTIHSIPYDVLVFGKPPPRPRNPMWDSFRNMPVHDLRPVHRPEPFTFYEDEEGPGALVSWSCASFRQDKSFAVEVSVEIEKRTGDKAQIEAVVTADNMKGDFRSQLIIPIIEATLAFDAAVDVNRRILLAPLAYDGPPEGEYDRIRWYRNDGTIIDRN